MFMDNDYQDWGVPINPDDWDVPCTDNDTFDFEDWDLVSIADDDIMQILAEFDDQS